MWRMKDKTLDGMETDKLKRNYGVYAVLLTALAAMTFFGVCDPSSQMNRGPQGSAAVVDGEVVSRNEFNRAYRMAYDRYQRMYADSFDPSALRLANTVMRELVDDRALYVKAVDLGMRASDDEVLDVLSKEDVFKDEKGVFSDEKFGAYLSNQGYTEAGFMEEVRRGMTLQKLRRFVTETSYVSSKAAEIDYKLAETKLDIEYLKLDPQKLEITVSAEDIDKFLADEKSKARVKEYYDQNAKEFNQAEQVKARHILVQFKGARNAVGEGANREKDAAKAKAEELLAKVKAPGADFVAIAKESTDEAPGKANGGDLGFFTKDGMDKAVADTAFAMNPGDVSGVVESPFGFHVIKVEEKKAAVATTLEQAQRKIAESLLSKEKRPQMAKERAEKVLAQLTAKQPVDGLLAEYKLAWAATGEVAADAKYLPGIGASKEVGDALAALTTVGQVHGQPVDVRGNLYVFRLKAKKAPDMSKFDKDKKREMALTAAYTEGTALIGMYEKQVRDELEKRQKIWMNPEYLALDERRAAEDSSGS